MVGSNFIPSQSAQRHNFPLNVGVLQPGERYYSTVRWDGAVSAAMVPQSTVKGRTQIREILCAYLYFYSSSFPFPTGPLRYALPGVLLRPTRIRPGL